MATRAPQRAGRTTAQWVLILLAGFVLVDLRPSHGQSAPAQRPTFRAGVDLVTLDVSVLDGNRQPVRGLSPADFTLIEDGVPQTIEAFSEVNLPDGEPLGTGWMARAASDVETNGGESRRLIAIVLDDAMLPWDPLFVQGTKKIAREIIERMGAADAAAVIFTRDNRHAQSFTTDRAKLLAAVDTVTFGNAYMAGFDDTPIWRASEFTLMDVALDLMSLPDRRKMLVFVSPGVPAPPFSEFSDKMKDIIERSQRANLTFYGFDPGGLEAMENFCGRKPIVACKAPPRAFHDYLLTIADNTDGKATIFTNDPVPGINSMFAENSSYYLLGYRQPKPQNPGDVRRIQITVDRPGVDVRSRHYNRRDTTDDEKAAKRHEAPPMASTKAIAEAIPDASTPLRLNLVPVADPNGHGATLIVTLGVTEPAPASRTTETVVVQMRAFTLDAQPRGERVATAFVPVGPPRGKPGGDVSEPAQVRFDVVSRLDVPRAGRYTVRVGVENRTRGTAGSVFADVDVPDFGAPLSLSGVALDATDAPTATSTDPAKPLLGRPPTTSRRFAAGSRATGVVRIYEHGTVFPVTVKLTIRDRSEAVVFEHSESMAATPFLVNHFTDFSFDVPLSRLQPGPHLLTVEVSGGDRVLSRELVFSVY